MAKLRRANLVRSVWIKEPARRTGLSRNTVRAVVRSVPTSYERP